ncbi:Peptidase A22A presenilin [Arabidopsis thaliana x Arabidopsis arenosa]|uniref:Peptidase A22A presenilin n=1 Tax=Arabidopsis thaliana x Arabidopsis arenosa TaxID=1240361 RepID=A0A8T2A7T1_9BRAS|nr:Peptidase A22A presenilin [Arabidopsis thaliana x Arabidopsis arenosa]
MDRNQRPRSLLDSLGEELIAILTPVSICMFTVVLLVCILNSDPSSSSASFSSIATAAYAESDSDSSWDKFVGALLNSVVFVAAITVATFVLVLLFYLRCVKFLKFYMGFSAFIVLGNLGGEILVLLIDRFRFPIDCITFLILLFNFSVVGVFAVFMSKFSILITQGYLVWIGVLVAYFFTLLPEWTTWVLLVALALYDIAAVLLPVGPLRLLVEMAISRDEDIPALVYEARPVIRNDSRLVQRRVWRERRSNDVENNANRNEVRAVRSEEVEEEHVGSSERAEISVPLIDRRPEQAENSETFLEGIGLGSSGAIKLGLGDFIFYSVLVGRAAMYDLMTVYACYLAIIAGLGITLMLLSVYQKALPALPVSIMLGVVFYFLARLLLEVFVVQCSSNLVMF